MKAKRSDKFKLWPKKNIRLVKIDVTDHDGSPLIDFKGEPMKAIVAEESWSWLWWTFG